MRILWLKSELLHPVDKGGKIRTYEMLKRLKIDHDITYMALDDPIHKGPAMKLAAEYCQKVVVVPFIETPKYTLRFYRDLIANISSRLPLAIEKYRSRLMRQEIAREIGTNPYDIVVSDFLVPSINLPDVNTSATILFQHNVESVIWKRLYEGQSNPIKRVYLKEQWRRMVAYEGDACRRFDTVIAVSAVDRDFIRESYRVQEVYDVPTGVDTEYFRPQPSTAERAELVFTGSMDWTPNEDAVVYFVNEILPRIHSALPQTTFTIVGRNPRARVRALGDKDSRVRVTGRVPDVRPYVASAAVYVVPLRVGGGTRLKIFEAMAMARPVVSTSIGAEGLPVRGGEELLVADDPAQFANAVIRLLRSKGLAQRIGAQGRAAVCERFSWDNASALFARICERVLAKGVRVRAA